MSDDALYIRCPTCRTVFRAYRVTLELQSGKVRCGQCRMVFDGRANLVEIAFDDDSSTEAQHPFEDPLAPTHAASPPSSFAPAPMHADAMARPRDASIGAFDDRPPQPDVSIGSFDDRPPQRDALIGSSDDTPGGNAPSLPDAHTADASSTSAARHDNDRLIDVDRFSDATADAPPEPALRGDAGAVKPTPFPAIGIDEDPLGIRSMPPAVHGPDTVSARSAGPETRSRLDSTAEDPITITAPHTIGRFGPATIGGESASSADTPVRHESVVMPEWKGPSAPPRGRSRWVYGMLATVMFAALALQALFHYRNVIAADYPVTRHWLISACTSIGCRIEALRNRDELLIDSHDLQADPAHQGLLILQTTLRNQARHALAFPHLELQLDDNAGKPIVRRVFTPLEYAGGAADFAVGIPANSEWNVKLFLDASSVSAGAYHLYHFYP